MQIFKCVVMGVCGSGKTSVGERLAHELKVRFIDGDDLHPRANVIKMRSGHPLNDEDRRPWLERVSDVFFSLANRSEGGVLVCSALKKSYRDIIRAGNEGLIFIHLYGTRELILERMSHRQGHYMKEDMVNSQFAALEFPGPDERDVVNLEIDCPLDELVAQAFKAVQERAGVTA
mgnify:FL=1